jgi:hypothetical protein
MSGGYGYTYNGDYGYAHRYAYNIENWISMNKMCGIIE